MKMNNIVKLVIIFLLIGLGIYIVLFNPFIVYNSVPKIILFLLFSLLPAVLFGAEAQSKFKLNLPGFTFVTTGAAALCAGMLLLLVTLTKPEDRIAAFRVLDMNNQSINNLQREGAVKLYSESITERPKVMAENDLLVLLYKEQVSKITLEIAPTSVNIIYRGEINLNQKNNGNIILGEDLKLVEN